MNWVGGARNRLRIKEEKKKQQQFFSKRKHATSYQKSRVQSPASISALSQDMLLFQTTHKPVKKIKSGPLIDRTQYDLDSCLKKQRSPWTEVGLSLSPLRTLHKHTDSNIHSKALERNAKLDLTDILGNCFPDSKISYFESREVSNECLFYAKAKRENFRGQCVSTSISTNISNIQDEQDISGVFNSVKKRKTTLDDKSYWSPHFPSPWKRQSPKRQGLHELDDPPSYSEQTNDVLCISPPASSSKTSSDLSFGLTNFEDSLQSRKDEQDRDVLIDHTMYKNDEYQVGRSLASFDDQIIMDKTDVCTYAKEVSGNVQNDESPDISKYSWEKILPIVVKEVIRHFYVGRNSSRDNQKNYMKSEEKKYNELNNFNNTFLKMSSSTSIMSPNVLTLISEEDPLGISKENKHRDLQLNSRNSFRKQSHCSNPNNFNDINNEQQNCINVTHEASDKVVIEHSNSKEMDLVVSKSLLLFSELWKFNEDKDNLLCPSKIPSVLTDSDNHMNGAVRIEESEVKLPVAHQEYRKEISSEQCLINSDSTINVRNHEHEKIISPINIYLFDKETCTLNYSKLSCDVSTQTEFISVDAHCMTDRITTDKFSQTSDNGKE